MKTTETGYINKNNQKNLGYRGISETHSSAKCYEMECLDCGHKYLANGCDIWLRKCPICATKEDLQVAKDLLDTLMAHRESCVGMAANMIGVRKRIIAFLDESDELLHIR